MGIVMRRLSEHHCDHLHRTERAFVRCAFRPRIRVAGEGPFAVLATCDLPSVVLHETFEQAVVTMGNLNRNGCGPRCRDRHEYARVTLPHPTLDTTTETREDRP